MDLGTSTSSHVDIALIGGGIMSATLGMLLQSVRPDATIAVFERLESLGQESSDPWNNAGTGHAALCEVHYTPERADGTIDIQRALLVNEQFQRSLQFYAWLVEQGIATLPGDFINPVPHVGFGHGQVDVDFLRRRHAALVVEPPFAGTVFSDDPDQIAEWLPLLMRDRDSDDPIAVTYSEAGTDVNFGALARIVVNALAKRGVDVRTGCEVQKLARSDGDRWALSVKDRASGETRQVTADFVFVGAGGAAVHLLHQSGIPEIRGVGGFPVSGQFLRCTNENLIAQHNAKVYGRPATGAPPMTAPHLDTRLIDGRRGLMFGPFAGFSPKFLKRGSKTDLFHSIHRDTVGTMLAVAKDEMPLTSYLVRQILQSKSDRIDHLRDFMPSASGSDWELIQAGQRVQVMRPTSRKRGILQYGTELITSGDGSIAGLLGASPGASTATAIMLDVLERCFPADYPRWQPRLRDIVPSLGATLASDPLLFQKLQDRSHRVLGLAEPALNA
ncbi:MAG: malate dehydrogenase (quinone) [Chloroflexia bacterium]|nr:malate dehydrogenase (quinone) [Chloroflexia bacterium]